jgi:hypothetical protein
MSLPSSTVDPGVTRLLDAIGNGASAADNTAAPVLLRLVLVLVNRVSALERKARDHGVKLDKLSKTPRLPVLRAPMTGGDGAAVGPERDSAPARPAPRPGRKDSPPRKRLVIGTGWRDRVDYERAHTPPVLDADWDG